MTRTLGEWEVEAAEAGSIKVRTPNGPVNVHTTYSDRYQSNSAANRLETGGSAGMERAMTEAVGSTKTAFSDADREAAQEAALIRARGPYQPSENVGILWFAEKHPAPWMRWVWMTPEIASYLLNNCNPENRQLRAARTDHYKKIMVTPANPNEPVSSTNTKWRRTHQGAAMDATGQVQDGQHRLAAVVAAANELDDPDFAVQMPFFVGMDPENFASIDEGLNRSAMDIFHVGGVPYGTAITTMTRLIIAMRDDAPRKRIRQKQTNEAILSFYHGNDPDELVAAARFGTTHARKTFCTAGPLSAAYYMLRKANGADNTYVAAFLEGLVYDRKAGTRFTLDEDDPRKTARAYFINVKQNHKVLRGIEALSIIINAWNNMVLGRHPRTVSFTDDTKIPRITICADKGEKRSMPPRALTGEIVNGEPIE
jgi:hypothetical protein